MNKKNKVMIFGTFDIFHEGHKNFLRQSKSEGNYLIVVIAREDTIKKLKKYNPINTEKHRLKTIIKSNLADEVILGNKTNKYSIIKKHKPDVICLGYDQKFFIDKLETKLKEFGLANTKVKRMKSHKPEIYESSKLMKN